MMRKQKVSATKVVEVSDKGSYGEKNNKVYFKSGKVRGDNKRKPTILPVHRRVGRSNAA